MAINKVLVIGSGTMGSGIAQVCAQAGIKAFISDVVKELVEEAIKKIKWSVSKLYEKGKLQEDQTKIMARIQAIQDLKRQMMWIWR